VETGLDETGEDARAHHQERQRKPEGETAVEPVQRLPQGRISGDAGPRGQAPEGGKAEDKDEKG